MTRRTLQWALPVLVALTAVTCAPVDDPRNTATAPAPNGTTPQPIPVPASLDQRISAAIKLVRDRDLETDHSFWTVFHGILGNGPGTELLNRETRQRVNAIDYICSGKELRGLEFIITPHGLDVRTRAMMFVGQGHQDQFIAEMAQWGMPKDRTFRIQGKDFTFNDFIKHSKMRARVTEKQELSWAIIIVGQYFGTDHSWTNSHGESLSVEDMIRYELKEPIDTAACGGTHRLFGLAWVYNLHRERGGAKTGVWAELVEHQKRHHERAKKHRNPDGSFSTEYIAGPGAIQNMDRRINTTGHVLEWLSVSLSDAQLREPWVQEAANALALMLLESQADPVDGGSLYHAAHGLHIYRARIFGVKDGEPKVYFPPVPRD